MAGQGWKITKNGLGVNAGNVRIRQQSSPGAACANVQRLHTEQLRRNAALIAAAPELLAACKAAFPYVNDALVATELADAIAKAERIT